MNQAEKKVMHDAMAEVRNRLESEPSDELEHFMSGLRYAASLLGMPEASTHYDWEHNQPATEGIPIQGLRASRREKLLRALGRRV